MVLHGSGLDVGRSCVFRKASQVARVRTHKLLWPRHKAAPKKKEQSKKQRKGAPAVEEEAEVEWECKLMLRERRGIVILRALSCPMGSCKGNRRSSCHEAQTEAEVRR
eukprot:3045613-Amphidinium_carterae.1